MSHTFTLYEFYKLWGLMISTNILQFARLHMEIVETKTYYIKDCELFIVVPL